MKALIFDMDGLMIDSERLYFQSERDIAADLYRAAEHIKALLGHSGQGPSSP